MAGSKRLSLLTIPKEAEAPKRFDRMTAREAASRAQGFLLDWDGCIAFNDRPSQAAVRFIAEHRDRVVVVSNNSTHRPEDFAQILGREGVQIPPGRVILAGMEALDLARGTGVSRVMIIGDSRMKAYAREHGLNIVREEAGLIVLLRDTRFSYAKLERAANCLRAGAKLIVSNPDLVHPGPNGRVVPETGSLLAALTACLGSTPMDVEVVGKPSPRLLERACGVLGVKPENALMIGDNPATDGAGAEAIGAPWIMVGGRSELTFDDLLARPSPETGVR